MKVEYDYYQLLGVVPTDDLNVIKAAYRRKAMQHHPDRGGSHEEMVLIQEAWEVLSDARRRRTYDESRAATSSVQSRKAAAADARDARRRAEQYPRAWAGMEALFNLIAGDFARAEYGSTDLGRGIHLPTAGGSVTGWLFILGGAILGGVFVSPLAYGVAEVVAAKAPKGPFIGLLLLIAVASPVIGGAWAGVAIHQWFKDLPNGDRHRDRCPNPQCRSLQGWDGQRCRYCGATVDASSAHGSSGPRDATASGAGSSAAEELKTRIVDCVQCGQKLRVPVMTVDLDVTCKSCRHKFECKPSACPKCNSPTGWDGKRCPWCGHCG